MSGVPAGQRGNGQQNQGAPTVPGGSAGQDQPSVEPSNTNMPVNDVNRGKKESTGVCCCCGPIPGAKAVAIADLVICALWVAITSWRLTFFYRGNERFVLSESHKKESVACLWVRLALFFVSAFFSIFVLCTLRMVSWAGMWCPIGWICTKGVDMIVTTILAVYSLINLIDTNVTAGALFWIIGLLVYLAVYGWFMAVMVFLIKAQKKGHLVDTTIDTGRDPIFYNEPRNVRRTPASPFIML